MLKLAVYDIDFTIISVNSLMLFYLYILKKYPKKFFYLPYLYITFLIWILKIINTKKVKELWLVPLLNINKKDFDRLCKDFIKESIIPKIKKEVIQNIKDYKKQNYKIVLASASYEFYIKYIADYLKADYCFGTKIIFNDNKMLAKIDGNNCRGNEKINRIKEVIPLNKINIKESVSYSDSYSDIPFLTISGRLYKIKPKLWKILEIIYK